MYCRESGQLTDFELSDVSETSPHTGRPTAALITCRRCRRPGLRARVHRIPPDDHGYAVIPHHYLRGDPE